MSHLPVDQLLSPLSDDAPCGDDLEYDPAFMALDEAARGKPEQQYGDTVIPPQDPDWRAVNEQALALAQRTRDLRVAVLLARSGARMHGVAAYGEALSLIAGLLEQQWGHVYPQLDADDGNDPTMRMNALAPLVDPDTGVADLRSAAVIGGRTPITVRQIELASGKVDPHGDESVPTQAGLVQAIKDAESQKPGLLDLLKQPLIALKRIETAIADQIGSSQGPDLKPLISIARWLNSAADQAAGGDEATDEDTSEQESGQAMPGQSAAPGAIRTRDDAIRTLERVCLWIEHNEPTNPAPLLIRRAQRLMGKTFLEIMRDMAPESLAAIAIIAGEPDSE
jgi:type VI secretion system protein ImpA